MNGNKKTPHYGRFFDLAREKEPEGTFAGFELLLLKINFYSKKWSDLCFEQPDRLTDSS